MSRKLIEMKAGILSDLRRGLAKDAHEKQRAQYNEDVLPERGERKREGRGAAEALMKIVINALCWRFMIADCVRWQAAGCGKCRELNATLSHAH